MMLPIGAMLQNGRYRIERYLSSGGFGNTYVVQNTTFGDLAAMKEFFMKGVSERDASTLQISVSNHTNGTMFDAQREKFKKEARRLRALSSPYLVKVHDLFEENGTAYYVMDYVDGESLSERMKRTGQPMSEDEVRRILLQILNALGEVHSQQIWHLDLKPGNIMIDRQGNVKIIDFGASKQLSTTGSYATTTTSMCYTPGFAPAEQIDQDIDRIGPWTDLYALGATVYNLLTQQAPPTLSELQEPDAFRFPDSVSQDMRQLVTWMMNPSRSRRPQSVNEVFSRIKQQPSPSLQPSQQESVTKPAQTIDNNATRVSANASTNTQISAPKEDEGKQPKEKKTLQRNVLIFVVCAVLAILTFSLFFNMSKEPQYKRVTQEQRDSITHAIYEEELEALKATIEPPPAPAEGSDEEMADYKAAMAAYHEALACMWVDTTSAEFHERVEAAIAAFEYYLNEASAEEIAY